MWICLWKWTWIDHLRDDFVIYFWIKEMIKICFIILNMFDYTQASLLINGMNPRVRERDRGKEGEHYFFELIGILSSNCKRSLTWKRRTKNQWIERKSKFRLSTACKSAIRRWNNNFQSLMRCIYLCVCVGNLILFCLHLYHKISIWRMLISSPS